MIKCQYCGREFTRVVNKNMHERYCKANKNINNTNKINNKNENNTNKNNENTTTNKCDHDFVLLNENVPNQRQAISQGYNAYCKKCNELT
jgi:hypothetical protein